MIRVIWEYLKEGWPYTIAVALLAFVKINYLPCMGWWLVLLPLYFWWPFVILLIVIVGLKTLFEELVIEKIKKWLKK